jgi:hypothetical protein
VGCEAANLNRKGTEHLRKKISFYLSLTFLLPPACAATHDPIESPMLFTDNVELFRRTRFQELAALEGLKSSDWLRFLNHARALTDEHLAILNLREAYARGSAGQMKEILTRLPPHRPAHRLFSAILENIEPQREIRFLTTDKDRVEIPLDRSHLQRGVPVVELQIYGRRFAFLWDTGSTENIMSHKVAEELDLVRTDVHFPVKRDRDGYVVRLGASHTGEVRLGAWKWSNFPWLISDLRIINQNLGAEAAGIDGVLSPQLLLPNRCFIIDRERAMLEIIASPQGCQSVKQAVRSTNALYEWNGEIYASVQILKSPLVGARLETGSNATFLRHDAVRYLPPGTLLESVVKIKGEIARTLDKSIPLRFAGRVSQMSAIELEASRMTTGHDDLATIGTDMLLRNTDRLWVDFATMSVGFLPKAQVPSEDDSLAPGEPKFTMRR